MNTNMMKKNFMMKKVLSVSLITASLLTVGCGQLQNPNTLNQGAGVYSGTPIYGQNGSMMNGQIPFTASGADLNNIHLIAGRTPTYGQKGTVSLSGGGALNNPYGINFNKNTMNGSIQYSVTQPSSNTQISGAITGFISLSQSAMAMIQSQGMYNSGFPGQVGQPGYNPSGMPQIQEIGIHAVHTVQLNQSGYYNQSSGSMPYATTGYINSAQVFVYLSNSSTPYIPVLMQ